MTNEERIKQLRQKEAARKKTKEQIKIWSDGFEAGYDAGHERGYSAGYMAALEMNVGKLKEVIEKLEQIKEYAKDDN